MIMAFVNLVTLKAMFMAFVKLVTPKAVLMAFVNLVTPIAKFVAFVNLVTHKAWAFVQQTGQLVNHEQASFNALSTKCQSTKCQSTKWFSRKRRGAKWSMKMTNYSLRSLGLFISHLNQIL
jgi:hypothetical protein